jgi:hypothetical protein
MHDLVTEDLQRAYPDNLTVPLIAADLAARKALGIERYDLPLQAHNGRDGLRDLYEELEDASVYTKQMVIEFTDAGLPVFDLEVVYTRLLRSLMTVRELVAARQAGIEGMPGA